MRRWPRRDRKAGGRRTEGSAERADEVDGNADHDDDGAMVGAAVVVVVVVILMMAVLMMITTTALPSLQIVII